MNNITSKICSNTIALLTAFNAATPSANAEKNNYSFDLAYNISQTYNSTTTNIPMQRMTMTQYTDPLFNKFDEEGEIGIKKDDENNTGALRVSNVSLSEFNNYKDLLVNALKKMGATEQELSLICDAIIINSIHNNRKVEDVAWAILQ